MKIRRFVPLLFIVLTLAFVSGARPIQASEQAMTWLEAAQGLEKRGDWPGLLGLGHRWTQAEADNPLAWFVLGRAYGEMKRHAEAITAYRQNLRVDPRDVYAHNNLGNAYFALQRYRDAMAAYQGAVRSDPEYLLAWRNLGQAFYLLRGPDGVAVALRQLQVTEPALALAWARLAATYSLTRGARTEQQAISILRGLSPRQRERMFALLLEGL